MELLKRLWRAVPREVRVPAVVMALSGLLYACALQRTGGLEVHRWQAGLGPVVPHDTFPTDCALCHEGGSWNELRADFEFDHAAETGVPLHGSHTAAQCLRCHNDRGAVQVFADRGCAGCHEDVHQGQLGARCDDCHDQVTWIAKGMVEYHSRTRFPLNGVHAITSCARCHKGNDVGRFAPTDPECVSCHYENLLEAQLPDHFAFGWVNNCDDCHQPTTWQQASGF
ncbi:hypothetical protein Pla163_32950 [Planctomycetes bacterium Pla163]|uniref:Cytochrome c7-like domain-containing protein n=1 Tax=Rohdeia mirabilis TaxID=2528008 RepID=A0A518D3U8_9BACT|nr:hypothetical protein Pla163_32950 [Planctomycetes bacterium Pla163]